MCPMNKNKKALITGASGSIGRAVAIELARGGADVALVFNKNRQKAETLVREIESTDRRAGLIEADIGKIADVKRIVKEASNFLGGLSILVHCAAVFMKTPLEEVNEETFDNIMNINLKGTFFLAQEAAREMKEGGAMIFLSDVAAQKPYPGYLPYCMSKAGVDSMVKGLVKKLSPKISVNAIAPYVVTRPPGMSDEGWNDLISKTPARRASPPEEIAKIAAFLADASASLTGQIIAVDGGRLLR